MAIGIHRIALELENLHLQKGQKTWAQFTTGLDFGVEEAGKKITAFLKDRENYRIICEALETSSSPKEKRGAQLLYRTFKRHHYSERADRLYEKIEAMEIFLMDLQNKNRAVLDGRDMTAVEVGRVLTESPDRSARKRAYESRVPLNKILVESGFIKLLDLRKEYAEACGAKDFVSLKLEDDELPCEIFDGWRTEAGSRKQKLKARERELAQNHLQTDDLMPWDHGYLKTVICRYNQAAVDTANFIGPLEKAFARYGFEIRGLNLTFDVFPRKNKSEWGYNFTLQTGKDSRILANIDNRFSSFWVLMHETGHGVHFLGLNPGDIMINFGVSSIVAEGFANFMGDVIYSREFLSDVFPSQEVEPIFDAFDELKRARGLQTFSFLATTIFDHELYRKDIRTLQDIHDLKWSIDKELLGQEPYAEAPAWARVIHHTCAPIYFHNYFLGDVMSWKMKQVFQNHHGDRADSRPGEFGDFWRNKVLGVSGLYPVLELYERVCEEKLSLGGFLDECVGG